MSKSCIKCGKKLGFRENKWNKEQANSVCFRHRERQLVNDTTCLNQLTSDMGEKDWICETCVQSHTLVHHIIAVVDEQREDNTGFRGRRKFKKWMQGTPLALPEIAPTWDLGVTGNESWEQLYDMMTEKIQNTEHGCPWCKKYFLRVNMVEMGFQLIPRMVKMRLECPNCAEIRSGLTSERLRNLIHELSKLTRKNERSLRTLDAAARAKSNADSNAFGSEMSAAFNLGKGGSWQRTFDTAHYASEANARYLDQTAEHDEIRDNIFDIRSEIEEEQLILAEQHFGPASLLPKKEPRREVPRREEPRREEPRQEETSSSCSNCGKKLKPTAKFCGSCGNQV